jgi:hypothetical protein
VIVEAPAVYARLSDNRMSDATEAPLAFASTVAEALVTAEQLEKRIIRCRKTHLSTLMHMNRATMKQ